METTATNAAPRPEWRIQVTGSVSDIDAAEWARLSGTARGNGAYNPFVSHAFLNALEQSGSAVAATGWAGQHLLLRTADGRFEGAVPCYLKAHSQGEYVFDHGWADAFRRAGGQYYPKLQACVPFTPVTGPRLLARAGSDPQLVWPLLAEGLKRLTEQHNLSSAHVTFAPGEEVAALERNGFLHRTDQQFHFRNDGYGDYADFLATLSSRKRKALRKERETALAGGIEVQWLTGRDLTESVWDTFFQFYMDTGGRKWGRPYLTRAFFSMIGDTMGEDIVLVLARRKGRHIAGALNFLGSDTIFGRYWGCVEDHPCLHFELCYHQAIDFAIAHGLATVEAGAQGEHKLARGYLPVTTHSAHCIIHPGFRRAVADYLVRERRDVEEIGRALASHGPFRRNDKTG